MAIMTVQNVRSSFLDFFQRNEHHLVSSASLVPAEDQTLLFTNAGMNQFKEVILENNTRNYRRAVTAQKCMRVSGKHNDLDTVGRSPWHHTFFEMLGNFSFGDYSKETAISLAWSLLTEIWALPSERLRATIFKGSKDVPRDDQALEYWNKFLPSNRIDELGVAENFWAMGDAGPCGPCSEIHYHLGDHHPCTATPCRGTACDCDRYIEIWNLVFVEFDRQIDGSLETLSSPSIDTGMGLERITAVLQGKESNYDTDLFTPLLTAISKRVGIPYGDRSASDESMRVIADHLRAMTFLIGDGVTPSNEWRGYVLRKIMRRAMRHGKTLGVSEPFLHSLTTTVIEQMRHAYPTLQPSRDTIVKTVLNEEDKFDMVLNAGLPKLEDAINHAKIGSSVVPGGVAFKLYDSLGVPIEFMEDLAEERQVKIDRSEFDRQMDTQRARARAGSGFKKASKTFSWVAPEAVATELNQAGDNFTGHLETTSTDVRVLMLWGDDGKGCEKLEQGETGYASLARTPFYLESGGQVSDTGTLATEDSLVAIVEGLVSQPVRTVPRVHKVRIKSGCIARGTSVTAAVDASRRNAIRRNHTATHLLHAALRRVLGEHVTQAGSLVASDRLRFDFTHQAPLTTEEIDEVEQVVSTQIGFNTPVQTEERLTEEAISEGAIALFGEKYGERVRVVSIPQFSMELCGGTHCVATGDIGAFTIEQESGIAAGVRRIEALTGDTAVRHIQSRRITLRQLTDVLGASGTKALEVIRRLQQDAKQLTREISALKVKSALSDETTDKTDVVINGVTLMTRKVSGLDKVAMRTLADSLKEELEIGVVVLASVTENNRVHVIVTVTPELTGRVKAGQVVKTIAPIVGGNGGGRADFAEAGGKDSSRIDELLDTSRTVIKQLLAQ